MRMWLGSLGLNQETALYADRYALLGGAGLLGGTVYGGKWLYHAVAKGLWHEDRKLWRYLSPWISLGATIGISALIEVGFMRSPTENVVQITPSKLIGLGFLIGYLADRFLAKMKELTEVLFGAHDSKSTKGGSSNMPP
jgi:hypothetical protein